MTSGVAATVSGKRFSRHLRDGAVQLLAARAQHGGIGGILYQGVLEGIDGVGRRAAHEQQFGLDQPDERILQDRVGRPATAARSS